MQLRCVAGVETPVAKVETPVAKVETPVAKVGTPVAKVGTPLAKVETPVAVKLRYLFEFNKDDTQPSRTGCAAGSSDAAIKNIYTQQNQFTFGPRFGHAFGSQPE